MSSLGIETKGLGRIYKIRGSKKIEQLEALSDVNIQIEQGELFGWLGPIIEVFFVGQGENHDKKYP